MEAIDYPGIYRITSPSGKTYIGSATRFRRRWNKHRTELRSGIHHCKPLQNAANKYGVENLKFEILLICFPADLLFYEQRFLDSFAPEYNMQRTAGSALGLKRSEETRRKLSEANRLWIRTDAVRAAMSRGRKGMKLSAEHRKNIGTAQLGKKMSEEAKRKIGEGNKGKKRSAEQIAAMSAQRKGKVPNEAVREKLRLAQKARRERERKEKECFNLCLLNSMLLV